MEHDASNIETKRTHHAPGSNLPFAAESSDDNFAGMAGSADPDVVLANDMVLLGAGSDAAVAALGAKARNALLVMAAAAAAGAAAASSPQTLRPDPRAWPKCCHCGSATSRVSDDAPRLCSSEACPLHQVDLAGELLDEDAAPFATMQPSAAVAASATPSNAGAVAHQPTIMALVDELVAADQGLATIFGPHASGILGECISDPTGSGATSGLNEKQRHALIVLVAALLRGAAASGDLDDTGGAHAGLDALCERITGSKTDPLLMAFLGEGGTGKSFVLLALRRYADKAGVSSRILWTASSGSAASLIGAWTFHSAFHLQGHSDDGGKTKKKTVNTPDEAVKNAWLIVIDEVSMVSKQLLGTGSEQCQALTGIGRAGAATSFWAGKSCALCGCVRRARACT
jgi:hypothetical protein